MAPMGCRSPLITAMAVTSGRRRDFTQLPNLTAGSLNMFINNRNGGSIGSSAQVLCNLNGALTTQGDVNIGSSNRNDGLGGGTMATDALVNIQANSISVGGVSTAS